MNKKKLARRISGKQKGHFSSDEWKDRKSEIARKVEASEKAAKQKSKLKITDDKGKEHQVGEIFESETLTLEI